MKILIIQASGIGCMIMATPALRYLRQQYPQAKIDLLVTQPSFALPVRESDLVQEVIYLPFAKERPWRFIFGASRRVWRLRQQGYDLTIALFPSRKVHFPLLSLAIGARIRAGHNYPGRSRVAQRLWGQSYTILRPANPSLHDVEQNLALIMAIAPGGHQTAAKLEFHLAEADWAAARQFPSDHRRPIGMHPGSSQEFGFSSKRWPLARFAELAKKIITDDQRPVWIFLGPEENDLRDQLAALFVHDQLLIVQEKLGVSAALMGRCAAFVSNDSALMHLAVAMGVTPTIGLFGPTNAVRTRPWGEGHVVIQKAKAEEVFTYPFAKPSASLTGEARELMTRITVDEVYQVLVGALTKQATTVKERRG